MRLGAPVDTPQAREKIARVARSLRDPDVAEVVAVRGGEPAELVSRDRRTTYLLATFRAGVDEDAAAERLKERVEREPGVTAGGGRLAFMQVGEQVEQDLARAELLAFPLLFLLSLVVFRSVVAALLPVAVGATTILATFLWLRLVNELEPMSVFAINLDHRARGSAWRSTTRCSSSRASARSSPRASDPARAARDAAHRRPHRAVQRGHGGRRDGRADGVPAAVPVLDGHRRRARVARPPPWCR